MRHGLIFSGGGMPITQIVSVAQKAEASGFDSIYLTEAWRSGFVGLAAIAAGTSRVEIGPYILNAYGRSVWLTAMSAVDLDELSGGRLVLGVGTGNKHINEDWQGIPQQRPVQKMREYVSLLKQAVATPAGETLQWQGELHAMDWAPAVQPVRADIPVYLAALYPKMTRVAAQVADGIALGALLSPDYLRNDVLPRYHAAAAEVGKTLDQCSAYLAPFVSVGEDAQQARLAARQAICHLYAPLPHPYYDYVLREQGFAGAADAIARSVAAGKLDKAVEHISDEMLDAVTVAGSFDECVTKLSRFEGLVDQVLYVNVNYASASEEAMLAAYDDLIRLQKACR